jgi:hypothetical protein
MARKLNARTEGLLNFVKNILAEVEAGNIQEAKYRLTDLIDDIGCGYVCQEPKLSTGNTLPQYNAKTDGDYGSWLVSSNID